MLDGFALGPPPPRLTPRADARELLEWLREGAPIDGRACVVVAHPDDETASLGARLAGFRRLTLVHLTDGAPEDPRDAERAGFTDADGYRRARAAELTTALAILDLAPRRVGLGVRDQAASLELASLAQALRPLLAGCEVVVTHAYEGGHPDHDAAAFAVQAACARLARDGLRTPVRLEFAGYHLAQGRLVAGRFWPDPARPAIAARIGADELERKRRALAAFRTQAEVLARFPADREAYRQAPDYDFTAPPPPGGALYDALGWPLTSSRWRALAAEAEPGGAA
jgi:LmbE family N-acetylglucosaminyl deacetylase